MDLGLLDINTLYEIVVLITPATRILRTKDGSHWSAPDHVFDVATAVGMSAAKLEHDYRYKNDFEMLRESQEFKCQYISMSQTPLDSTNIGMNTTNATPSHLDLTPIGTKTPYPKPIM